VAIGDQTGPSLGVGISLALVMIVRRIGALIHHTPLILGQKLLGYPLSKAPAWRPLVPGRTSSASSHTSHTLRINDRRAEWQVSWGFWSGPVDWPGAETAKNRSPEANSLRAS
jgi:hypothetical protein